LMDIAALSPQRVNRVGLTPRPLLPVHSNQRTLQNPA
jgi:hypothetical protein